MEDKSEINQSSENNSYVGQFSANVNDDIKLGKISPNNTMDKPCGCTKEGCSCNSEGRNMLPVSYVYAIGKVIHRFPNRSVEMELAQTIGQMPEGKTKGLTNPEVAHNVFTDPNNRYIARQICYILTIEGLETYILVPSNPLDFDRLAQALRRAPDV